MGQMIFHFLFVSKSVHMIIFFFTRLDFQVELLNGDILSFSTIKRPCDTPGFAVFRDNKPPFLTLALYSY